MHREIERMMKAGWELADHEQIGEDRHRLTFLYRPSSEKIPVARKGRGRWIGCGCAGLLLVFAGIAFIALTLNSSLERLSATRLASATDQVDDLEGNLIAQRSAVAPTTTERPTRTTIPILVISRSPTPSATPTFTDWPTATATYTYTPTFVTLPASSPAPSSTPTATKTSGIFVTNTVAPAEGSAPGIRTAPAATSALMMARPDRDDVDSFACAATDCEVVAILNRDDELTIIKLEGSWIRVRLPDEREVYVRHEFVEITGTEEEREDQILQIPKAAIPVTAPLSPIPPLSPTIAPMATASPVTTHYTIKDANARSCANTTCSVVMSFPPGAAIQVIGFAQGGAVGGNTRWVEAQYSGRIVYIHSSLVSTEPLPPTPASPAQAN